MADMISKERAGDTGGLAPYLQSLVLPQAETWFTSEFGNVHCHDKQFASNECLGPRLFFAYEAMARNLPASFAMTLRDLIDENLTNFEAVNYSEPCPGPIRINTLKNLVGSLTTTPVSSSTLSGVMRNRESLYALWIYNNSKETLLAYFVYSAGAFRYIGMPHEESTEHYQRRIAGASQTEPAPPPQYLTEDQSEMNHIIIDAADVQRTVVLVVNVGKDGKVVGASYVRGPEAYKDAAIETVRKRTYERPGFGPRGFHGNILCERVLAPR